MAHCYQAERKEKTIESKYNEIDNKCVTIRFVRYLSSLPLRPKILHCNILKQKDKWPGNSFEIDILIELEHTNVCIFSQFYLSLSPSLSWPSYRFAHHRNEFHLLRLMRDVCDVKLARNLKVHTEKIWMFMA